MRAQGEIGTGTQGSEIMGLRSKTHIFRDRGKRTIHIQIPVQTRRRPLMIPHTWLCLFYLVVWTTDVSLWVGHGRARLSSTSYGGSALSPTIFCFAAEDKLPVRLGEEKTNERSVSTDTDTNTSIGRTRTGAEAVEAGTGTTKRKAMAFLQVSAAPATQTQPPKETQTFNQILYRAGKSAVGGGIPGALAGAIQVLSLMWLRTIINYQCRYGTTFSQALRTLLHDGGIARLYCGVSFALIQAPLVRFISTAANDGVKSLLANLSWTKNWGPGRTTLVASIVVGLWRILLMPIDTAKTVLQIDSLEGFRSLMRRAKAGKIGVLYSGALATAIAAILGHYPWFYTYNLLSSSEWIQAIIPSHLLRNAGIGVASSIVSDAFVNVFRVIKTTKQSLGSKQSASYSDTVKIILAADGWRGLFGRGLQTRIFANALQSLVFTIVWRGIADYWKRNTASEQAHDGASKRRQ